MNTKTTVISRQQLDTQLAFCSRIAAYWHEAGRVPTAYVETYGCQQNEADSERIRGILTETEVPLPTPSAATRSKRSSCAAVWPVKKRSPSASAKASPM